MNRHWAQQSIIYHIYPLGFCGAPHQNDFHSTPVERLGKIHTWIPHMKSLGINTLYLGPLFESTSHGYDTVDYFHVDRRLGTDDDLVSLVSELHAHGIKVVLDGVFNHVGRNFWALHHTRQDPHGSPYRNWFAGYDPNGRSPLGDPFSYEAWEGHFELVKLNLGNPEVREHLLDAVDRWIDLFGIDGLRLDVAYCLDKEFLKELVDHCRLRRNDFWLLGEMIHGDYRMLLDTGVDSVTNYECYKGLYSSHNDGNLFEIAYALNRQFGSGGLYRSCMLYNFADNHDVTRIGSMIRNPAHLHSLHCLLFTMPGIPSVYYGSEWGIKGLKEQGSDWSLRPSLDLDNDSTPTPELARTICTLSQIRKNTPAILHGDYTQLYVASEQLAFSRRTEDQEVVVLVNTSDREVPFSVPIRNEGRYMDLLNENSSFESRDGRLSVETVFPCWARILLKV